MYSKGAAESYLKGVRRHNGDAESLGGMKMGERYLVLRNSFYSPSSSYSLGCSEDPTEKAAGLGTRCRGPIFHFLESFDIVHIPCSYDSPFLHVTIDSFCF